MEFRALPHAGYCASRGIISTSWDCRWHCFIECCGSTVFTARKTEVLPPHLPQCPYNRRTLGSEELGFFLRSLFPILHRRLEIANTFTQSFAEIGQLAGTED